MYAFSLTSLVLLLSALSSLEAVSLVPKHDVQPRRDTATSMVIDASDGELQVVNRVIAPDGFSRSATLADGVFPGPLIKAQKGQNFSIKVTNMLHDPSMELSTSVHWHGIFQNRSNWADGVSFVTQCPILPNQTFHYRFNAERQTGTFWYHSHHGLQYCDGLRGPLVIYDPTDPHAGLYDVDDESTVITLADWWHSPTGLVLPPFTPNATLINGNGRYSGGPKTPFSVIKVEQGKRYRLRIINMSCDAWHNFTIDGHRFKVIETDGIETEPVEVDSLPILAGQRYSVVLTADRPVDNYWLRALPNHGNTTFIDGQNMAILRYVGAPLQDPTTSQGHFITDFEEGGLHPLQAYDATVPGVPELGKADVTLNLVPGLVKGLGYTLNGAHYRPAPVPILLQLLSGARHPSELLPGSNVIELPRNKVIEINMPANELTPGGATGSPHGIHLHGHAFHVIRTSTNSTPNFINPVRRDTVSMGSEAQHSNITIRFATDNPGPWILHCHVDFHLYNGFGVIFAEAPEVSAQQQGDVIPDAWRDLCPRPMLDAAAHFNTTGHFDFTSSTNSGKTRSHTGLDLWDVILFFIFSFAFSYPLTTMYTLSIDSVLYW